MTDKNLLDSAVEVAGAAGAFWRRVKPRLQAAAQTARELTDAARANVARAGERINEAREQRQQPNAAPHAALEDESDGPSVGERVRALIAPAGRAIQERLGDEVNNVVSSASGAMRTARELADGLDKRLGRPRRELYQVELLAQGKHVLELTELVDALELFERLRDESVETPHHDLTASIDELMGLIEKAKAAVKNAPDSPQALKRRFIELTGELGDAKDLAGEYARLVVDYEDTFGLTVERIDPARMDSLSARFEEVAEGVRSAQPWKSLSVFGNLERDVQAAHQAYTTANDGFRADHDEKERQEGLFRTQHRLAEQSGWLKLPEVQALATRFVTVVRSKQLKLDESLAALDLFLVKIDELAAAEDEG